jgi:cyclopropane fatty-acyl-phospholipid synthase-like methyltransferase
MTEIDYTDFDVVVALECIYYLGEEEQEKMFKKIDDYLNYDQKIL